VTAYEIIVGADGSGPATAAVRWAAREAERHDAMLRVVYAYEWNWQGARFDGGAEFKAAATSQAEQVVAQARWVAHSVAPGIPVRRDAEVGNAVPVLVKASEAARMIVVGNRGRGGFASLLLGSVGQAVATLARCPVVVVRGRTDAADGPVVVGADGSPASVTAVELAFEQAAALGTNLVAIRAYEPPVPPWGPDVQPLVYDRAERESAEHQSLDELLSPWRDKYPLVPVEGIVTRDHPARVLVGVSRTARLIVVGSHGHSAVAGTLLGSVGSQLLHHADCPVLIART
jgi:nucleotide-binding universal stress UspA family protein